MKRRAWPVAAGLLYIAAVAALGGLRADHVIIGLLGFLDLYNEKTRSFLALFFPFILTGVIYDSMRYYYWPAIQGRVHVREPYRLELSWFGIDGRTPNEWMDAHRSVLLDLACGFAYLVYVGEYLAIGFLLFFRRRFDVLRIFAFSFLLVNLLGFATYFIYPAAPPWYVSAFGLGPARMDVHSAAAAASRFDALLVISPNCRSGGKVENESARKPAALISVAKTIARPETRSACSSASASGAPSRSCRW